jgi:type IV secretion system protein VirD4
VRTAFAPNNIETAEWLSKATGVSTVVKEHISTSGARFAALPMQNISRDFQESSRPLMTIDEVLRLKGPTKDAEGKIQEPGEILVFVTGHAPIRGTQSLYFRDPTFLARARIAPPTKAVNPEPAITQVAEFVL